MKVASLLMLVVLLSGCAGKAIEPSYYLMRSDHDQKTRELNPSKEFSMGTVVIASYIDQPGLLIETVDGEMRAAQYNLWAEPVYEGVRNKLVVEIGRAKGEDILPADLGNTAVVLDIRLDQLHGTNEGTAKLMAYWWLRRGKEVIAAYQFAEEQALVTDGYAALVAAEEALLTQLAEKIAATLVVTDS
jgi:uncharacterized lipoprotein YmbA